MIDQHISKTVFLVQESGRLPAPLLVPAVALEAPLSSRAERRLSPAKTLRYGRGQLAADLAERVVDVAGDHVHAGGCRECNQGGQQCVFDQILTGFLTVQGAQNLHKTIHHGMSSLDRKKFSKFTSEAPHLAPSKSCQRDNLSQCKLDSKPNLGSRDGLRSMGTVHIECPAVSCYWAS